MKRHADDSPRRELRGRSALRMIPRCAIAFVTLGVVTFSAAMLSPQEAGADVDNVTTCNASGAGSLPAMVESASSGDTITFSVSCPPSSPISLGSTIDLTKNVTIDGPGASTLAISGSNAVRVFEVHSGVTAIISSLTIEDGEVNFGSSEAKGGGIDNEGTLALSQCRLLDNSASLYGGGLFNGGLKATLTDDTISGNSSLNAGGGVFNASPMTVTASTFTDNSSAEVGGAIINDTIDSGGTDTDGSLTVTGSTISDNDATGGGGGIWNVDNTPLTVTGSTLSGNTASGPGGGIYNDGSAAVTVTNTTLSDNAATGADGGAIWNDGGLLTVTDSLLSSNSASGTGGGINNTGRVTVTDSTLSNNSSDGGGGILNNGTLDVTSSTLAGNSASGSPGVGGGIFNGQDGTVTIGATIFAHSASGGACTGVTGGLTDLGYNLDDDGSCGFSAGTDISDMPAGLDPAGLQNNGGPTRTIALEPGSNAIGRVASASLCSIPDQRGALRSVPCDTGAYETNGGQTIAFASTPPSPAVVGDSTYVVTATATSGLPVALTVDALTSSECSISGAVVTFIGLGTCTIDGDQIGNSDYGPAPPVQQSFAVLGIPTIPTITNVPSPGVALFGGSFVPTVNTNGDGTTTVTSSTSAVCTVSSAMVHYVGVGTCTLTASVAAGASYTAGEGSPQIFSIDAAKPSTPTITNIPGPGVAVVGGTFVPFVSTTGDGTTSVTSSTSSVCTVSSGTVSYIGVGNCSLTAQVAAGTNYGSASGSAQGFGVGPSLHAITSPDSVSTMVGSDLSFNVITSGAPVPAIGVKGKLPKTFSFVNNGNGTATLTGTPTKRGVYGFTIKATFGRGKTKYVVTQAFSLIVDAA